MKIKIKEIIPPTVAIIGPYLGSANTNTIHKIAIPKDTQSEYNNVFINP